MRILLPKAILQELSLYIRRCDALAQLESLLYFNHLQAPGRHPCATESLNCPEAHGINDLARDDKVTARGRAQPLQPGAIPCVTSMQFPGDRSFFYHSNRAAEPGIVGTCQE
ncbi:MAG: hypothetical protein IPH73_14705 [Rhodocyclales bacterium]|nr:hypothetical protein [Rhodocyclales bacterium]